MRIRNQLLLLVLSILLPAMLASALAVAYVYREKQDFEERSMSESARALAFLVQDQLQFKESVLRTLSHSPSLQRGDLSLFYQYANSASSSLGNTITLTDENGRQLFNTRRPLGDAVPPSRHPDIDALMQQQGADKTLVSDLIIGQISKQQNFVVQIPVIANNDRRYFLLMTSHSSRIQEAISKQNFPPSWIVTVVDRKGSILARSHDPQQHIGRTIRQGTRNALAGAQRGIHDSANYDDTPVKVFFHRVANSDWSVMISVPKSELRAVPLRAAAFLGGILLLLLGGAVAAAHWFTARAYRPVESLGLAAEQLGQGLEVSYTPQGMQEIDAVGKQLVEASLQIRQATQRLEQRVAQAVAQTEQAQQALQRSQKLEALGRLTGGIAHEFNNLLQTLVTALQVAKLISNQERVQSLLDTCRKAVDRATTLTSKLSAFGRLQESKQITIDLNEQIRVFENLIKSILPSNIELNLQLEDNLWPVTLDTVQLELALLNIAINARDAMPNGGVFTVKTSQRHMDNPPDGLPAGEYVRICLDDTGQGMSPEVLAKALDPFFTTKEIGKGSGLGLPQAYGFARQSQGTLVLASQQGKGTTVEIILPRASETAAESSSSADPVQPHAIHGGSVLFVEDDPLVREAVAPALGNAGFAVRVAASADEALAMLESDNKVNVLFSDIMMPGQLNGIGLARTVQERYPDIKVILATGYTDQLVHQEGITLISKPYETSEVVRLLQEAIDAEPGQPS